MDDPEVLERQLQVSAVNKDTEEVFDQFDEHFEDILGPETLRNVFEGYGEIELVSLDGDDGYITFTESRAVDQVLEHCGNTPPPGSVIDPCTVLNFAPREADAPRVFTPHGEGVRYQLRVLRRRGEQSEPLEPEEEQRVEMETGSLDESASDSVAAFEESTLHVSQGGSAADSMAVIGTHDGSRGTTDDREGQVRNGIQRYFDEALAQRGGGSATARRDELSRDMFVEAMTQALTGHGNGKAVAPTAEQLKRAFDEADVDGSGYVDRVEFERLFESMQKGQSKALGGRRFNLKQLWGLAAGKKKAEEATSEGLRSAETSEQDMGALNRVFIKCATELAVLADSGSGDDDLGSDTDAEGRSLSLDGFVRAMGLLCDGENFDGAVLRELFAEADSDRSGTVDFGEFAELYRKALSGNTKTKFTLPASGAKFGKGLMKRFGKLTGLGGKQRAAHTAATTAATATFGDEDQEVSSFASSPDEVSDSAKRSLGEDSTPQSTPERRAGGGFLGTTLKRRSHTRVDESPPSSPQLQASAIAPVSPRRWVVRFLIEFVDVTYASLCDQGKQETMRSEIASMLSVSIDVVRIKVNPYVEDEDDFDSMVSASIAVDCGPVDASESDELSVVRRSPPSDLSTEDSVELSAHEQVKADVHARKSIMLSREGFGIYSVSQIAVGAELEDVEDEPEDDSQSLERNGAEMEEPVAETVVATVQSSPAPVERRRSESKQPSPSGAASETAIELLDKNDDPIGPETPLSRLSRDSFTSPLAAVVETHAVHLEADDGGSVLHQASIMQLSGEHEDEFDDESDDKSLTSVREAGPRVQSGALRDGQADANDVRGLGKHGEEDGEEDTFGDLDDADSLEEIMATNEQDGVGAAGVGFLPSPQPPSPLREDSPKRDAPVEPGTNEGLPSQQEPEPEPEPEQRQRQHQHDEEPVQQRTDDAVEHATAATNALNASISMQIPEIHSIALDDTRVDGVPNDTFTHNLTDTMHISMIPKDNRRGGHLAGHESFGGDDMPSELSVASFVNDTVQLQTTNLDALPLATDQPHGGLQSAPGRQDKTAEAIANLRSETAPPRGGGGDGGSDGDDDGSASDWDHSTMILQESRTHEVRRLTQSHEPQDADTATRVEQEPAPMESFTDTRRAPVHVDTTASSVERLDVSSLSEEHLSTGGDDVRPRSRAQATHANTRAHTIHSTETQAQAHTMAYSDAGASLRDFSTEASTAAALTRASTAVAVNPATATTAFTSTTGTVHSSAAFHREQHLSLEHPKQEEEAQLLPQHGQKQHRQQQRVEVASKHSKGTLVPGPGVTQAPEAPMREQAVSLMEHNRIKDDVTRLSILVKKATAERNEYKQMYIGESEKLQILREAHTHSLSELEALRSGIDGNEHALRLSERVKECDTLMRRVNALGDEARQKNSELTVLRAEVERLKSIEKVNDTVKQAALAAERHAHQQSAAHIVAQENLIKQLRQELETREHAHSTIAVKYEKLITEHSEVKTRYDEWQDRARAAENEVRRMREAYADLLKKHANEFVTGVGESQFAVDTEKREEPTAAKGGAWGRTGEREDNQPPPPQPTPQAEEHASSTTTKQAGPPRLAVVNEAKAGSSTAPSTPNTVPAHPSDPSTSRAEELHTTTWARPPVTSYEVLERVRDTHEQLSMRISNEIAVVKAQLKTLNKEPGRMRSHPLTHHSVQSIGKADPEGSVMGQSFTYIHQSSLHDVSVNMSTAAAGHDAASFWEMRAKRLSSDGGRAIRTLSPPAPHRTPSLHPRNRQVPVPLPSAYKHSSFRGPGPLGIKVQSRSQSPMPPRPPPAVG